MNSSTCWIGRPRRDRPARARRATFLDTSPPPARRPRPGPAHHRAGGVPSVHSLTVGGGVRQVSDIQRLLNAGADKIINSAAVANPSSSGRVDYRGSLRGGRHRRARRVGGLAERTGALESFARRPQGHRTGRRGGRAAWLAYGANPAWTTAPKSGFDLELTRAVSDAPCRCRHRLGRRRQPAAPGPMVYCKPPSSDRQHLPLRPAPLASASASWPNRHFRTRLTMSTEPAWMADVVFDGLIPPSPKTPKTARS